MNNKPERLLSLDILRGITIIVMLLVNNLALDIYSPVLLVHANWNKGITIADLVFPFFIFCVGAAIPFSYASFLKKSLPAWRYDLKIINRTIILFIIGLLINSSIVGSPVFSLGVLQLIALSYCAGAFLYDLSPFKRIITATILLLGYWALIKFVAVPGSVPGIFEENMNILRHINFTYLSRYNLNGLLSVIPATALVIIGSLAGNILQIKDKPEFKKIGLFILTGMVLTAVGLLAHLDLGFNKTYWTPSLILFSSGLATLILSFLYVIADVLRWKFWAYPFLVFGSNAIFAYTVPILTSLLILQKWHIKSAGSNITIQHWLYNTCFTHFGRIQGGWIYTIGYIFFWWVILCFFYKKRIFFKV